MDFNKKTARLGGVLYLIIFVSGIFAQVAVRDSLIVSGDATATANNIMASGGLFRLGITADTLMLISDVALALVFYVLLKPVNEALALLAAFFRLAQAAVLGINLLNLFFVIQLLSGASFLNVFDAEQLNSFALLFLDGHATGYRIGLVFFALQCLVAGYLIFKSGYFPKILGIGLAVAGVGYLVDSFANFLMPNYTDYEAIFNGIVFIPAVIAELALTLWLLVKGVKTPDQDSFNSLEPISSPTK